MAFVVSNLPDFSKMDREQMLTDVVLGGRFKSRMTIQPGIKKNAVINYLATAPALADGASCGFSASGDTTLTQRTIATAALKVNMSWCPETLLGKYAEYKVRLSANPNAEALPFEEEIVASVESHLIEKSENLIWWGDTSNRSTDANLKWHNGLIALALADNAVIDVSINAGTSAFAAIKAVYMAIPVGVLDRAEIYVATSTFRQFAMELMEKNLYHYADNNTEEIVLPGTNTKVVAVKALEKPSGDTYGYIFAADPKELYFGCDLDNAMEDARIWFSDDDDIFKGKWLWNQGVQYAFGSHIVLGQFTTLTSPSGQSEVLNDIAGSMDAVGDILTDVHNSAKHSLNSTATA